MFRQMSHAKNKKKITILVMLFLCLTVCRTYADSHNYNISGDVSYTSQQVKSEHTKAGTTTQDQHKYSICVPAGRRAKVTIRPTNHVSEQCAFHTARAETSISGSTVYVDFLTDGNCPYPSYTTLTRSLTQNATIVVAIECSPSSTYISGIGSLVYETYRFSLTYDITVVYEYLKPDLTVTAFSTSPANEAAEGENVVLSYTIKNSGGKVADASTAYVYDGETKIGEIPIASLATGGTSSGTFELPSLTAGSHALKIVVDAAGAVEESNENNNTSLISISVYARTPYTVNFNANGGYGMMSSQSFVCGTTQNLRANSFTNGDKVFMGWATSADGSILYADGQQVTNLSHESGAVVTLYAVWAERFTVVNGVLTKAEPGLATHCVIPSVVTAIGTGAFEGCSRLQSVIIPSSVTNIEAAAFKGCSGVTNMIIPKSVMTIGSGAFSGCSGLESITLPFVGAQRGTTPYPNFGYVFGTTKYADSKGTSQKYSSSSSRMYYIPIKLREVVITDDTALGYGAFYNCSELTEVSLPENTLMSMSDRSFYGCSGLMHMTIPGVFRLSSSAFAYCSGLTNVVISEGCNEIESSSFGSCSNLVEVSIPSTMNSISELAFLGCKSLLRFNVNARNDVYSFEGGVLVDNPSNRVVCCPNGLGNVIIPDGIKVIGREAFRNCSKLDSILIPSGVTNLEFAAFYNCSNLRAIELPDTLFGIDKEVFGKCSSLTTVTIPAEVNTIGDYAFEKCGSLVSVVMLPPSVKTTDTKTVYTNTPSTLVTYVTSAWTGSKKKWCDRAVSVREKLTILLDANGGVGEMPQQTLVKGVELPLAKNRFEKNGYVFVGWSLSRNGSVAYADGQNVSLSEGQTLYAVWDVPLYAVTFDANGGSGGWTGTLSYGAAITAPTVTRVGYTFVGWSPTLAATVPVGGATYTAQWEITKYTVTLDPQGGIGGTANVTATYGNAMPSFTPPTRTGYTFGGYWTGKNGTGTQYYTASGTSARTWGETGSVTLYAKWTLVSVEFPTALDNAALAFTTGGQSPWFGQQVNSHDGLDSVRSGPLDNNQTNCLETTVSGPGTISFWWYVSSEENFDFLEFLIDGNVMEAISGTTNVWVSKSFVITTLGSHLIQWRYRKDGSRSYGDDAGFVDQVAWTPTATYTVTYKPGSYASGLTYTTNKIQGVSLSLRGGTYSRTGYTQTGWATADGGAKVHNLGATYTANVGVTLYPYWTANQYAVTLNGQGGSGGTSSVMATYGSAMPSITLPTRTGYTFGGYWTGLNGTGTQYYTASGASAWTWNGTSATTLYAVWNKPLSDAVDNDAIGFTSTTRWQGVPDPTAYDGDSARSGMVPYGQTSWMDTMVTNRGTLSFRYKVSGGWGDNLFAYRVDSDWKSLTAERTNGTDGEWIQETYSVTNDGEHLVRWVYAPNVPESVDITNDCAWIDQVVWSPLFTFDGNGGTPATSNISYVAGQTFDTLPTATREGYWFGGWFTLPDGGTQVFSSHTVSNVGVTLYAQWSPVRPTFAIFNGVLFQANPNGFEEVTIPYNVRSIGRGAFAGCSGVKNIVIPNNVTNIDDHAFVGCGSLSSITIPASVSSIGNYVFIDCTNLTSVTVSRYVCSKGIQKVFGPACQSITNVVISEGVTSIEDGAFYVCPNLASLTLPNSIRDVSIGAFGGCVNLRSVTVPQSVFSSGLQNAFYFVRQSITDICLSGDVYQIKWDAFKGFPELRSITVAENNATYTSVNGLLLSKDRRTLIHGVNGDITIPKCIGEIGEGAFYGCGGLAHIKIPDSVTTIGRYAFRGCTNLTEVTIPAGVESIGDAAFANCMGLVSVTFNGNAPSIGGDCFANVNSSCTVYVKKSAGWDWYVENFETRFGLRIEYLAGLIVHGVLEQAYLNDLTEYVVPDCVTTIGRYAFRDCHELRSLTIPSSVTGIYSWAFDDCFNLKSVTVPQSVCSMGLSDVFGHARQSITNICLSSDVTLVRWDDFLDFTELTAITVAEDNATYTSVNGLLLSKDGQTLIRGVNGDMAIPECVREIGKGAFCGCRGLAHITIPDSVTTIERYAFNCCTNLTEVTIPAGVKYIGDAAFADSMGLVSVTFNGDAPSIGGDCFANVNSSCTVYLKESFGWERYEEEFETRYGLKVEYLTRMQYTVTFDANGGIGGKSGKQDYGSAIFPPTVTRTGYTFKGWIPAVAATVPAGDVTYTAQWEVNQYTVTFGKNGGTGGDNYVTATYGQAMPTPRTAPKKDGYMFDGYWNTTGAGGVQYYDGSMKSVRDWDKTGDATLWAKWRKAAVVKVTLSKNGGTGGDSYVTCTEGQPMPTPRTAPTLSGWTFAGYWDSVALDANGNPTGKQYYDASMKSVRNWDKTSATTLWAKWTNKVTLGKNGGTGGDSYVTCTKGQPMPKRTMPMKSGYVFDGYWTTTGAGGVKYYNSDGTSAHAWDKSGSVTLWAKWVVPVACKVTFGKNGGTGGDNYVTATSGKPMPTPRTAPTRAGWTFAGYWDTLAQDANGNPTGKQYYDKDMKSVRAWDKTSDATLWAKWTVRVKLGKNGGTGGDDYVTVTYNQPFPKRTMPKKSGYTFGGYWVSASSKTGQCYNADGTGTSSMKWTTGGSPTVWALWTKTSSLVEVTPPNAVPSASAAPAAADPAAIPAGLYSGVLADGSGTFCLMLDEAEEGVGRTAYLYVVSEDGLLAEECSVVPSGLVLFLEVGGEPLFGVVFGDDGVRLVPLN